MTKSLRHPLICVVGPTASGKTALAQGLAEYFDAAVLSADSMQVYAGMDIGTGKIAPNERTVDYYGLDLVKPDEPYSVALFQEYSRAVVEQRDASGAPTIVCGGTGFYVRALIDDFEFPQGEQCGNQVRDMYTRMLEAEGAAYVWSVLDELDHESAQVIPKNDSKRVIRALELHAEGLSYALQREKFQHIAPYYPCLQLGLRVTPDVLVQRIDSRVDAMLEAGLVNEVSHLLSQGYETAITANQAIGYKEIVAYLRGACSLDAAVEAVKLATRRYAKRQRTWFNKDSRIYWLDADKADSPELLNNAVDYVKARLYD